jgi:3-hydroxyacyl-[acyl-carrier-protein] dehydratase
MPIDDDIPRDALDALQLASKHRLVPMTETPIRDRSFVEGILKQRPPFLFTHRVMSFSEELRAIETRFDLAAASDVFAGHFPEMPLFPAVLQLEAIAQAGMLAYAMTASSAPYTGIITHVHAARFLRPVKPAGELAIVARIFDEGMFLVMVGQCIQSEGICSAACLAGVEVASPNDL